MRPSTKRKEEKKVHAAKKLKQNKQQRSTVIDPLTTLTKYVDVLAGYTVGTTATIALLNGIALGTGSYQRTNRAIFAKDLKISLAFTTIGSSVGWYAADVARIIVVWDKEGNTTPLYSDVLLDILTSGSTGTTQLSHKNINNKDRFIFLFDTRYHLPSYSVTVANTINMTTSSHAPNDEEWSPEINIKLKGLFTRYDGTGSTISSISSGVLYFYLLGGSAPASSGWGVTMTSRFSYHDSVGDSL